MTTATTTVDPIEAMRDSLRDDTDTPAPPAEVEASQEPAPTDDTVAAETEPAPTDDTVAAETEPAPTDDTVAAERTIVEVPVGQIQPNPHNRAVKNIDDLIPSIREHGVLQPILVRRWITGELELVAGERRWRAAQKAGLATIPARILDNLGDDITIELQLIENLQRQDLDPLDEATGYQRLLAFDGWNQRRLAERLGVSQSHVSKRLSLLDLPDVARKALDSGGITVTQATELARLTDHPEIIAELLVEEADEDYLYLAEGIQARLRDIERAAALAKKRAEVEAKGITVLERNQGAVIATWGFDIDAKMHAKEPCHAVALSQAGPTVELVPLCTDTGRHGKTGESTLKSKGTNAAGSAQRNGPTKTAAQAKKEADEREATRLRRAHMAAIVGPKAKITKANVYQLIARRYLDDAAADEATKVCQLLGIELEKPKQPYERPAFSEAIDTFIAQSETHLLKACLAFALVQGEWGYGQHRDEHRRILLNTGYEPHPSEQADFDKATKATVTK